MKWDDARNDSGMGCMQTRCCKCWMIPSGAAFAGHLHPGHQKWLVVGCYEVTYTTLLCRPPASWSPGMATYLLVTRNGWLWAVMTLHTPHFSAGHLHPGCQEWLATYILVTRNGWLWAGTEDEPHPAGITIKLEGTRQTPAYAIREDLNLGSKVSPLEPRGDKR
eukprot:1142377-Pelagomonas_calceolata.AAC.4